MTHQAPYTYHRDGVDEIFYIADATGKGLASVPFWDEIEQAEATARHIVAALNAYAESDRKDGKK